jgi:hypothetical protein
VLIQFAFMLDAEPSSNVVQPVPGGPCVAHPKAVNATSSSPAMTRAYRFIVAPPLKSASAVV